MAATVDREARERALASGDFSGIPDHIVELWTQDRDGGDAAPARGRERLDGPSCDVGSSRG